MECTSTTLPYGQTGYFSKIVVDYINQAPALQDFYAHPVSMDGIKSSIKSRQKFHGNRSLLVQELRRQYSELPSHELVNRNIDRLMDDGTFTICTAHQPCIFTGTLFFIYKILHAIKLAQECNNCMPEYHFVPVYYMGSEDADLDELGKMWLNGEQLVWDAKQTGAVGRMNTKGLDKLIYRIEGELSVLPYGKELLSILKECYLNSPDIATATFKLVHTLFAEYGLVVLLPDNAEIKKQMLPVFEEDLFQQKSSSIVEQSILELSKNYKVQANPREINLFYLYDNIRERFEREGDQWRVVGTDISFSEMELKAELYLHPERFSPNVILRGIFQETILPNIAFIGGGGELAYWLEFKSLFEYYKVPYPLLVLRNSFLFIEKKWKEKIEKIGFTETDIFKSRESLLNELVKRESHQQLTLLEEVNNADEYYGHLKSIAGNIDETLVTHVSALQSKALKSLLGLEKKLLRAEKKKFDDQHRQIVNIKSVLFPQDSLQERIDNFMPYYAKWGKNFMDVIYRNSPGLEQEFVVLTESE
ncbi:MAG: bacillithiol biosynthesis cysteine-adding enzyme BshC [Chitinophagaceae bacterium]|nr:bacillithiol biosynthesis cysteine-adding enzyme BshC [Chitinophagaceae bacterium]